MTDQPREKLCELIATYGQTLCDDPRRCEALLRDVCGAYRREIHVLVSALRERVAADLLAASEGVPREVLQARLTQRLRDNLGLTEESARWAVDSWALALGKLSPTEVSQATTGATPSAPVKVVGAASTRRGLLIAGLGIGLLVVLVVALLNVPQKPERPAPNSQRKPEETRQEAENMRGPYPFGQVDPVSYLKSLIPAAWGHVWQGGPHIYCLSKQKEHWLYCVGEQAGTVSVIILPLRMVEEKTALTQSLVWLKLTEGRDGEDYLVGSPYTLNELTRRLAETSREIETSRHAPLALTLGPHTFLLDRERKNLLVTSTDYIRKEAERYQSSSTPGRP